MNKFLEKLRNKRALKEATGKKGFTLIELLVVIGILAILVLLAAPSFLGYTKDANVATMQADTKVLSNAALIYNIEEEGWPSGETVADVTIPTTDSTEFAELDEAALNNHIQSLKNDITDYVIATNGSDAGTVYHAEGVEDRDGIEQHGVEANEGEEVPAE